MSEVMDDDGDTTLWWNCNQNVRECADFVHDWKASHSPHLTCVSKKAARGGKNLCTTCTKLHPLLTYTCITPKLISLSIYCQGLVKLWVDPNISILVKQLRTGPRWPKINALLQTKVHGARTSGLAYATMRLSSPIPSFCGDNITVFLAQINKSNSSTPRYLTRLCYNTLHLQREKKITFLTKQTLIY